MSNSAGGVEGHAHPIASEWDGLSLDALKNTLSQISEPESSPAPQNVRCPECGGRDTHRYWDAPGTVYTCDDCEGRSFELEEE